MSKSIPGGYNGKILRVNLSSKRIATETIDDSLCRKYLGGAGFITYYLWKELKPGVDALDPGNKLIFALGPITGLTLPGASRNCIGAKSPLTGGIAKAEVGGFWMAELKRAGYDAIIVEGRAEKPVYLWVHDGQAEIKDAHHLWGKETKQTEATIRAELGDDRIHVAMIGPGGENMVRFACIMQGLRDAAGRGGLGAVMGSKNLKAIAARGHRLPPVAHPERLREIKKDMLTRKCPLSQFGTGGPEMVVWEEQGNLPVRNFRDGIFPGVKKINGRKIKDTIRVQMDGCFACPVRCKKVVKVEKEPYIVDSDYGGPEYETLAALGSDCGIDNLEAIARGNERCGAHSIDTISTGGVIAFAMECLEKGLLTKKDTGGLDLKFGNEEAMLKAIELIARREGIGNLLAEGTLRMARKIGKSSEKFAIQVKGLECGQHEPRVKAGLGLGYMVNPHGGDHVCNILDEFFDNKPMIKKWHPMGILAPIPANEISPFKVGVFKMVHSGSMLQDSMAICVFPTNSYEDYTELIKAVTGWDTGIVELLKIGERILTLARLFNIREGFTDADDTLPERFFQSKTDGVLSDKPLDRAMMERARKYYYALMGWDANGVPLPEKVAELQIE